MSKIFRLSIAKIQHHFEQAAQLNALQNWLINHQNKLIFKGLTGSALSFVLAEIYKKAACSILLILEEKEEAAYIFNDLEALIPDKPLLFYPASYKRPYQIEETDNANILLRSEVLNKINSSKKFLFTVTYPDALFEKVVTKSTLKKNTLTIRVNDAISLDFVNEVLFEYQFQRVDFVSSPGEFSVRGGIVDVFSFSNDKPYRIEFFGNEVESIRTFDIETQLSLQKLTKIQLLPNIENKAMLENRESFLQYIPNNTLIIHKNSSLIAHQLNKLFEKSEVAFQHSSALLKPTAPDYLYTNGSAFSQLLANFKTIQLGSFETTDLSHQTIVFNTKPQPSFNKHFELLFENLQQNTADGFTNYLCCTNDKQAQRFHDIFEDLDLKIAYKTLILPLYQGFIDVDNKIVCYTDHQIFERYHKFRLKEGFAKNQSISLKELTNLEIGDYVTHIDHGIGKFGGLQKIEIEGKQQETIKLIYGDRDLLYISIHSLHKISKYNSRDGSPPKLYKLGSGAWQKVKQKTKQRVKEIAFDLIQLYAKRKLQKGFAFSPDSYMQHELESSFMYEDTPDQYQATQTVKADMENEAPMDRLVCGDVGFGKTEVAIRAAFKAVDNGKQVAVLVPTTILAYQHYQTFKERLAEFPLRVDYLNRFRSAKDKTAIYESIAKGEIDIIIGTHQLTNKELRFKDLGLLVIDEEQKFGVAVKDKLKTIKENVDTLTLTATPIPRTLQFSLMAARDLSVINTPPPNRQPIETNVIGLNEEVIRDAIMYEISRGGQVFFIHNRIENIKEVAGMLQRLIPDAKIGVGHGQLDGKKLEQLMFGFVNNEFDILVSTTIVESGLDVPNANTIFINNANNFGLSDLHQMRGRVGRSNKKAFCFLITPPYHHMTDEARKRITAIETFTDLGSGIHIALKDLEIRGAGDLLGGEQSGFINDIGFETYQKILNEAIEELKENEFKELYQDSHTKKEKFVKDFQLDADFELLIPDNYVNIVTERMNLYKELADIETEELLLQFENRLIDRFGSLPNTVIDLLNSVRLKWMAKKLGMEHLVLKNNRMIGYFIGDQQSDFYQSEGFAKMLQLVNQNTTIGKLKEKETKNGLRLLLSFDSVSNIDKALELLSKFNTH